MNFERPESNQESNIESLEAKKLRVSNDIQKEIMSLVCSPDDGESCFVDWINDNALQFHEIFEEVLKHDDKYLDKWDKNIDNERDRSLDFFMSELEKSKKMAA